MNEREFYFMLPSLVEEQLLPSDNDSYSLTTFPRTVASAACKIFVKDFATRLDKIDTSRKKRVKLISEILAVSLSLEAENFELMNTAVTIYHKWLRDLPMFGPKPRQNKFIRRIFKHLSLPFAFREAKSRKIIENDFYNVLTTILTEYEAVVDTNGPLLEVDSWNTLFKCVISVTDALFKFNLDDYMEASKASSIRQKAFKLVYKIAFTCGITDKEMWTIFNKYNKMWSSCLDLVIVWDLEVSKLHKLVLSNLLGGETDIEISGGIYIDGKKPAPETINFLYRNVVFALDVHMVCATPQSLFHYQMAIARLLNDARQRSSSGSLFIPRFPGTVFLKLFGPAITSASLKTPPEFDDGFSTLFGTLLTVAGRLDFPNHEAPTKLASMALQIADLQRPQLIAALMYYGTALFSQWRPYLPAIARRILTYYPLLDTEAAKRFTRSPEFWSSATSLYLSAAELAGRLPGNELPIRVAFQKLHDTCDGLRFRVPILMHAQKFGVDTLSPIVDAIVNPTIDADSILYYATLFNYFAFLVRENNKLVEKATEEGIYPGIVQIITSAEAQQTDGFDVLFVAALNATASLQIWGGNLFTQKTNVNALFDLIAFALRFIKADAAVGREKETKKTRKTIRLLTGLNVARACVHAPDSMYFTRHFSTPGISEAEIEKKLGMKDAKRSYFTVGSNLLVCIIETADKMAVFSRGPFGRGVWTVTEEHALINARLSTQLSPETLPKPPNVLFDPYEGADGGAASGIDPEPIEKDAESTKQSFLPSYSEWKDWKKIGMTEDFGQPGPSMRPRVVDFLATIGLVDEANRLSVRVQNPSPQLDEAIKKFDSVKSGAVVPIPIIHIMQTDSELKYSPELRQRMTPLFKEFMESLGEPMDVAGAPGIPTLRTTAPAIPFTHGSCVVVAPSMAVDDDGAEKIFKMSEKAFTRLIFNETSMDVKLPRSKVHTIVVRPLAGGIYHVTETCAPGDGISPFLHEQALDARSIRQFMTLIADYSVTKLQRSKLLGDPHHAREEALKPLVVEKASEYLAPNLVNFFE